MSLHSLGLCLLQAQTALFRMKNPLRRVFFCLIESQKQHLNNVLLSVLSYDSFREYTHE